MRVESDFFTSAIPLGKCCIFTVKLMEKVDLILFVNRVKSPGWIDLWMDVVLCLWFYD